MPVGSHAVGGAFAPLVAGWDRWRRGEAFGPPAASPMGGDIPGSRKVELYISEQWVDVTRLDSATPGVYYRDNITITRGRSDESVNLDRGTCKFTLNNRDGRFSPRNPNSPYFGKLGRNTPVRVSVVQATGVRRYRFYGEVSSWPQKWDQTGTDVYVQVEASGVLRRLGQGQSPLSSAMYRGVTRDTDHLVAYWPCEDAAGSTSIAAGIANVTPMAISGTPTLRGDDTSFVASEDLPVMANASFTGYVPAYTTTLTQAQVRFFMSYPSAGGTNGQIICSVFTTGTIPRWELYYGSGGSLGLRGFDALDVNVSDTGSVAFAVNGTALRVSLEFTQTGSSTQGAIATLAPGATVGSVFGASGTGTLGHITRVVMATNKGLTTVTLGHVTVQSKVTSLFDLYLQIAGNASEQAGSRIARLCAEEGINYARRLPVASTMPMGVQTEESLLDLIRECVDADLGRLSEPRDQVGLAYRDRESLYDQTAVLALDYAAFNLSDSLDPVDDDQFTRNDVTVKRGSVGSSARATKDTGALSIGSIGRYDESVSLNVYADSSLADLAGWKLHLGTTDEARYPTVDLNLSHSTFTSNDAMMTAALVLDVGDKATIANPPAWLPPNLIGLIVEGYTEVIGGNNQHTLSLNCSPSSPHTVAVYDSSTYRYSSDGSTLATDVDSTTTTLSVATPSGPLWSVTDGSFDITMGGERMTVTNITGATSPQSFTVTRSVNTVVKTHTAGEDVSLFQPAYYAI
jgi:hypothetical protein